MKTVFGVLSSLFVLIGAALWVGSAGSGEATASVLSDMAAPQVVVKAPVAAVRLTGVDETDDKIFLLENPGLLENLGG